MEQKHVFDKSKGKIKEKEGEYYASCECGWNSQVVDSKEEAVISFENHVRSDPSHEIQKEKKNYLSIFLALLCILYIVSPVDIVPDYLIGVGWIEDAILGIICFILIKGGLAGKSPTDSLSDIF